MTKTSNDSIFGLLLAIVALVALLTVSESADRTASPLSSQASVSNLGLRVSMHR